MIDCLRYLSKGGKRKAPLREVVHCVLLGASCGQGMISVDFQSDPIITGGSYSSPMLATASSPPL